MTKRWLCVFGITLFVSLICRAGEFTDGFDVARDFLTDGVSGSDWDGFLGDADGATNSALSTNIDRPGELYMDDRCSYLAHC